MIKYILILRTAYNLITNGKVMRDLINETISICIVAELYINPNIPTAYYTEGTAVAAAINTAILVHNGAPTPGNNEIIQNKVALGVIWMDGLADQVEVIANADANRTTAEEASTNIKLANMVPQKLTQTIKGTPVTPVITAENVGTGKVAAKNVTPHGDDVPDETFFMAIEMPAVTEPVTPDPIASITLGQFKVILAAAAEINTINATGKGKTLTFIDLKPGVGYMIIAYTKNGNKFISELSNIVYVQG
jgi:hypothetical protein